MASKSTTSHIASALPIATLQLYYMNVGQADRKDIQGLFPVFHAHLQDDPKSKLTRKESIVHKIKKRIFSKSKKGRIEVPQPASRPTTVLYSPRAQSSSTRPALDMSIEAEADENAEARIPRVADHAALDNLLSLEALPSHAGLHEEATQQVTKVVTELVAEPNTPPFALAEHTNSVIRALKSTATEDTPVEPVLEASPEKHAFLPFRLFDDETVIPSPNPTVLPILHDKDDVVEQSALNPPMTDNWREDEALLDATSSIEEEFFSAAEHFEKGGLFTHAPSKEDVSEPITRREEVAKLTPDGFSPICKPLVVAVASLGVFAMLVPIMSRVFRR